MASYMGNTGNVKVGDTWATGIAVSELRGWTAELSAVAVDASGLTDAWDKKKVGSKSARGTIAVFCDPTDTTGQGALEIGAEVELHLSHMAGTTGQKAINCSAIITGHSVEVQRNQPNTRGYTWESNGTVTEETL